MNGLIIGFAILVTVTIGVLSDSNCTSSCTGYARCTSIQNTTAATAFLDNSLSCSADYDTKLGKLFDYFDSCKLKEAAIQVADLMEVGWDGVSALEDLISDEDLWLDTCEWEHMGAAACVYFSLPDEGTCSDPNVSKQGMFCPDECMKIANSCLKLDKYIQLKESITTFCDDITGSVNATNCYKAQVSQPGVTKPSCTTDNLKTVSLVGPYVVGGVGLALAVVALIGLALNTCRRGDAGVPNSF